MYNNDYLGILKNKKIILDQTNIEIMSEGHQPKFYASEIDNIITNTSNNAKYIVKTSLIEEEETIENEHFCLWLSTQCNINTSKSTMFILENKKYLVLEKFDTKNKIEHIISFLSDKERKNINLSNMLKKISTNEVFSKNREDIFKGLFSQMFFSLIIGNYDFHANNFAFLYDESKEHLSLSPTYDIMCTKYLDDSERAAIKVNKKHKSIKVEDIKKDFLSHSSLTENQIESIISNILKNVSENYLEIAKTTMPLEEKIYIAKYIKKQIIKGSE